jgi:uroporphyrinogen-III synthase
MTKVILLRSSPSASSQSLTDILDAYNSSYKNIFCYKITENTNELKALQTQIINFENIIFTSPIATEVFCEYINKTAPDLAENLLCDKNIFTVGSTTANTVTKILPKLTNKVFFPENGSGFEDLKTYINNNFRLNHSSKIAVIQGSHTQYQVMPYETKNFICYNKADIFSYNRDLLDYFMDCSFIVIFSSNIAEIFGKYIFKNIPSNLLHKYLTKPIIAIHNNIAQVLLNQGFVNVTTLKHANQDCIVKAIINWR